MAKPRIFISSTYYDLRSVRADIDRFISQMGYEPVLFERGHVPYGGGESLEEDCYREVSTCDILIAIIGGKFGTSSKDTRNSISQSELRTAIKSGKQIYIFVERSVFAEYGTWVANKNVKDFTPTAVNDVRVFTFLEEIYSLTQRNPVQAFEISEDITLYLREQWSGLFQMLLQEHARQNEINLLEKMETTAATLDDLVNFLTQERNKGDEAIKEILLTNHPLFQALKKALGIPYRIFFETVQEMEELLKARQTTIIDASEWESPEYREYLSKWAKKVKLLRVKANLFDDNGNLRVVTPKEWNSEHLQITETPGPEEDDDLPF